MAKSNSAPFVIPDQVTIRGQVWQVRRWHQQSQEERDALGYKYDGLSIHEDRVILLKKHSTKLSEARTFLHELLHACCPLTSKELPMKYEEKFVASVEKQLLNVLSALEWIK